jgi:dynein heavy chain
MSDLQRMLIVRCLRQDRIIFSCQNFVTNTLGQRFVEPPNLDVADILKDSSPKTPLIFILSPGVDPTVTLTNLAAKKGMSDRFTFVALGQGQAPKAVRLIEEGIRNGNWVFLANCHLSISFLPQLDKIIESIPHENPHADFRLWLSSSPHPQFPISILQNSLKMTTEPPKGIKANLVRMFGNFTPESFEKTRKPEIYQKLVFCLAFFHATMLERKKFLTLGWNVVYDFNE